MRTLFLMIVTLINCVAILHGGCKGCSWEYFTSVLCITAAALIGSYMH